MATEPHPDPEHPAEEGVATPYPDETRQEGAHLLANQARDRLTAEGFTDAQIFEWAVAFSDAEGGGTVEEFVRWIEAQESTG
ncbi:hypothetical protein [Euzebya sp.]|uniref:hypothetical protein n=1 Tax=Euzebya sp. TaxID=1971409 RepID=UPI003515B424